MLTREETQQLAKRILSFSQVPECSVSVTSSQEYYTRFANNGITTSGFSERRDIVIQSTRDQKTGVVRLDEVGDDALRAAVKRSEELSAIAPPNPEHQPPLGPQEYRDTSDYDERTATARAAEMAPQIKAVIDTAAENKLIAAGLFERFSEATAVANKAGLFGYHLSADARMSTTIRAADGSSSGWAGQPSLHIAEIDGRALANTAIEKCVKWKNPKRLDAGKYTVVFEPTAAGDIVRLLMGGFMGMPFGARATEEGRTFLSKKGGGTHLGEKMFPDFINLHSDPYDPREPALPWTPELLPNRPITWIENGTVSNLIFDRYWASRTGKAPTPFPTTLILDGTDASTQDLIKTVDRGLLVTHFWYIRFVNPQTVQNTGLTRDGLFLIENGKVTDAVMNLRFNDSPVRLLQNAQKLGKPVRVRGLEGAQMIAPPIVAKDFTFTSVSDAV